MFITHFEGVSALVLVFAAVAGTGLMSDVLAAEPPHDSQKQAAPKNDAENPTSAGRKVQHAKTDRQRLVGNWFITNDDSQRKGEMWVITEDSILMYANYGGANSVHYAHRLDASKNPKQIDITVSRITVARNNGPIVGVIKGIYVLDGDELRLCLGEMNKDRPAAFPEKPTPGEALVLHRSSSGATPPAAKVAGEQSRALTPAEAIQQREKEPVTVQFKVASVRLTSLFGGSDLRGNSEIELTDGTKFSVLLRKPVRDQIVRLGIEPAKHFSGKILRVTGRVEPVLPPNTNGEGPFWIIVEDLKQFEVVREQ
jgi:uncharacterized protein (TIGR03067 family)